MSFTFTNVDASPSIVGTLMTTESRSERRRMYRESVRQNLSSIPKDALVIDAFFSYAAKRTGKVVSSMVVDFMRSVDHDDPNVGEIIFNFGKSVVALIEDADPLLLECAESLVTALKQENRDRDFVHSILRETCVTSTLLKKKNSLIEKSIRQIKRAHTFSTPDECMKDKTHRGDCCIMFKELFFETVFW